MRIAVTYDNDNVGQHFGMTEAFKLYTVEGTQVLKAEVVGTNGKGHRELIPIIQSLHADAVICGGCGTPVAQAIASIGAKLYPGVSGSCDEAVQKFLSGTLATNDAAVHVCDHDHHHHHE